MNAERRRHGTVRLSSPGACSRDRSGSAGTVRNDQRLQGRGRLGRRSWSRHRRWQGTGTGPEPARWWTGTSDQQRRSDRTQVQSRTGSGTSTRPTSSASDQPKRSAEAISISSSAASQHQTDQHQRERSAPAPAMQGSEATTISTDGQHWRSATRAISQSNGDQRSSEASQYRAIRPARMNDPTASLPERDSHVDHGTGGNAGRDSYRSMPFEIFHPERFAATTTDQDH